MRSILRFLFTVLLLSPATLTGTTISLGIFSFDNLIPDGDTPGVNVFDIYNFTGATYGLPSDFPVSDELTLQDVTLTLEGDLGEQQFDLGDIDPGVFSPPSTIEFSDTINFTSATLTATLSESTINLYDGTSFTPSSETITATILPSSGNDLVAGTDSVVIAASEIPPVTSTPEPSTVLLLSVPLFLVALSRRSKSAR